MFADIVKSFVIGICASAPIGPVAILVTQKTLIKGRKAGFFTGLGACVVDTVYAVIAISALAIAQNLIRTHQDLIMIAGGVIVTIVGAFMMRSNPFRKLKAEEDESYSVKDFLQSMVMGFSNPGAILVAFALFAFFGVGREAGGEYWRMVPIILAVFLGTVTWWYFITWGIGFFRNKISPGKIFWISRLTEAVVIVIGIVLFARGLWMVL